MYTCKLKSKPFKVHVVITAFTILVKAYDLTLFTTGVRQTCCPALGFTILVRPMIKHSLGLLIWLKTQKRYSRYYIYIHIGEDETERVSVSQTLHATYSSSKSDKICE